MMIMQHRHRPTPGANQQANHLLQRSVIVDELDPKSSRIHEVYGKSAIPRQESNLLPVLEERDALLLCVLLYLGAGFARNPSSKSGHKNSVVIHAGTTCGRKIDGRKMNCRKTSMRGLYFSAPHFSARPDFCKQTPEKNSRANRKSGEKYSQKNNTLNVC